MSSWCRNSMRSRLAVATAMVLAGAAAAVGPVEAAETYVRPQVNLRVENNDNFDLAPNPTQYSDVYGYIADLQALIGIATPRSDTSLRPRARLQEYPDRDDRQRTEAFLDLKSSYRWERSEVLVIGRYSYQDQYNAERPGGEFDPLDPTDPYSSDSSTTLVSETRSRFQIRPQYTFSLTERTRLGAEIDYQTVQYESKSVEQKTDYDYTVGNAFVEWTLDPRSEVSVGAYASKYQAKNDTTETVAYGGEVGYRYRWSDVTGIEIDAFYEQDETTDYLPVPAKENTSGWGGTVTGYRKGELSEWRASVGHIFIPTGSGSKAESDLLRVEYDRNLTQRLSFAGAARYEMRNSLTDRGASDDRDYARGDLSLKWLMAPTWYLEGGYSYIWEDRESNDGDAANNQLFVSVGYKGLGRRH